MGEIDKKKIEIPEIVRVEGHSAVTVDIVDGKVSDVRLDVFEGARFFERIVLGHKYDEIAHLTSRVCAICSTGHVLAAIFAIERIFKHVPSPVECLFRELMHLGMIIESHATHVCALALPDFLGTPDLISFASEHKSEFQTWTKLRNLGAAVQTIVGGRPFHPVNLHVGGMSRFPVKAELEPLLETLNQSLDLAIDLCVLLKTFKPPVKRLTQPIFLSLIPNSAKYGFFGDTVRSSDGWEDGIDNYKQYLAERVVPYSHAKRSDAGGKPIMVGSMARLFHFGDRLVGEARSIYETSPLANGDTNTIWNNLAQAIEIVEAISRASEIVRSLLLRPDSEGKERRSVVQATAGHATGAVECPRGTLYHFYDLDDSGTILAADMVTPSAQNTARIELDIKEVVGSSYEAGNELGLESHLETLIRAYDPCNTCATHMVQVKYRSGGRTRHGES